MVMNAAQRSNYSDKGGDIEFKASTQNSLRTTWTLEDWYGGVQSTG